MGEEMREHLVQPLHSKERNSKFIIFNFITNTLNAAHFSYLVLVG